MAVSLGFGVLFSTFVILLLVPALYVILEDLRALSGEILADIGRLLGRGGREEK